MEFAYNYTAKSSRGQVVKGTVFAKNKALAFAQLKRGGFFPLKADLALGPSLRGMFSSEMHKGELSRLYVTVGRRLRNGKSMVDGLEAAIDYLNDPRLRQAVMQMRQGILDGQTEYQAMMKAGFPRRDCLVIRSTAEAGKTGESFAALGDEIQRTEALRKSVASTFRVPAIMGVFMVLFVWAALMFIAPATLAFLKQTGLRLNFSPLIANYFELVKLFHIQPWVSTAIYFGGFGAFVYFLKSKAFKDMLDRIKTLRDLSVKSDHASLWNSFSLLYDAAVPAREAAAVVGESAKREDSKLAFKRLAKMVQAGRSIEDSVASAGFPRFVVAGVASAASGGNMVEGLSDMSKNLEEDVQVLTEVLQENAKIFSILAMGGGVLIVFIFTYYPMLASVMSNV